MADARLDAGATDCTEQKRLNEAREAGVSWKKWGPYLSERQWGTGLDFQNRLARTTPSPAPRSEPRC